MGLQKGREDEHAPDAVDDRGNAGEKFDGDADRAAQGIGAEFGEEDGDAQADRHGDDHAR